MPYDLESTITPPALRKGSTIAFVSPSSRLNTKYPTAISRAKSHFETLGFPVKIIFNKQLSGTHHEQVLQRVEELQSAFRDPEIGCVLTTVGGSYANELLRWLDYDMIRANPKPFIGFSDTSTLHNAILTQAGLRTFYGPAAWLEFGDFPGPMEFTNSHFFHVLSEQAGKPIGEFPRSTEWQREFPAWLDDEKAEVPRALETSPSWSWVRPGKATGRILGGVFTSLLSLAGTKYWPDFNGAILLIESSFGNNIPEAVDVGKTRWQLGHLADIGVFDQIAGMVVGRQVDRNEERDEELRQVILDQTYGYPDFPILMNVDVGHTDPHLTVPLGALVRLDSERDEWVGLEPAVV